MYSTWFGDDVVCFASAAGRPNRCTPAQGELSLETWLKPARTQSNHGCGISLVICGRSTSLQKYLGKVGIPVGVGGGGVNSNMKRPEILVVSFRGFKFKDSSLT